MTCDEFFIGNGAEIMMPEGAVAVIDKNDYPSMFCGVLGVDNNADDTCNMCNCPQCGGGEGGEGGEGGMGSCP